MSVCISEERWQGMLCVAWVWRVPWPPNSHLAAAQGQEGLDMDRGAGMLWEHRVLHAALPSSLDSRNGTGTPSSSAHLWGKACLDQTAGTPRCPLEKGVYWQENILGNAVSLQVLSLSVAFSAREWMLHLCAITATSFWSHERQTLCHRSVVGFHWVEKAYLQAGYSSGSSGFG